MQPMRVTRITMAAGAAMVLSLLLASATLASGPAPNPQSPRWTVIAVCDDGNSYNVTVESGGRNIGAGQIVDTFGHAILVHGTMTQVDVTQGNFSLGSWESFHGIGHTQQAQTSCVVTTYYSVSQADVDFGLPTGVYLGDLIKTTMVFTVVLKV